MENEIDFWIENFDKLNFRKFSKSPSQVLAWTDASSSAVAGICTKIVNVPDPKNILSIDSIFKALKDVGKNYNSQIDVGNNCNSEHRHIDTWCDSALIENLSTDKYELDLNQIKLFTFFHRMLNELEIRSDSNEREIIAAKETLFGSKNEIRNKIVTIHLDNSNAAKILEKGSTKLRLHEHAIQVDNFCIHNNIELRSVNIPRDLNRFADKMSNC